MKRRFSNAPSARERILQTAARLFYTEGIRAVGVDRVVAEAEVAKATLYAHFPSKEHLVVAYLERSDRTWRAELEQAAAAAGADPRAQLVGVFDAITAACRRDGYAGCGFLNAGAETRSGDAPHRVAVRHKREVRRWLALIAAEAGARDPEALAETLAVLIDGALADTALEGTDGAAKRAKDAAAVLVAEACGDARPLRGYGDDRTRPPQSTRHQARERTTEQTGDLR